MRAFALAHAGQQPVGDRASLGVAHSGVSGRVTKERVVNVLDSTDEGSSMAGRPREASYACRPS